MGRMPKKGVDYFSHDVTADGGKTLFTVQQKFGNDGYALWFKLLEYLGTQETLSIDFNDVSEWEFFIAKARVSEDQATNILNLLASINAIDPDLWKSKIVWSENFVERVADVYKKRGTETPKKPEICDRNPEVPGDPGEETPQRKGKKSKAKKSKEEQDAEKIKFAEFVKMKQTEYDKLVEKYGKAAADKMVEVLDNYKGAHKKHYDSDYRAILTWVVDKVKKEQPGLFKKLQVSSSSGNPFEEYLD